jgi:hypothetical protein
MKKFLTILFLYTLFASHSYADSISTTKANPSYNSIEQPFVTVNISQWNMNSSNIQHKTLLQGSIYLSKGAILSQLTNSTYVSSVRQTCKSLTPSPLHPSQFIDQPASEPSSSTINENSNCLTSFIPSTITTGYQFTVEKVVDNTIYFKLIMSELLSLEQYKEPIGTIQKPLVSQKTIQGVIPYTNHSWHYTFGDKNSSNQQEFDISIIPKVE